MRTLGIMQPYFFPYLGYWQLIRAVDKFIIYDNVNYIKSGWINRNRILINGEPKYITVPLEQASPNRLISDINTDSKQAWREKLVKAIALSYGQADYFPEVFPVIETLVKNPEKRLTAYLTCQLQTLSKLMGIHTEFLVASTTYENGHLTGQDRVLEICTAEGLEQYVNAIGGKSIYDSGAFKERGITLKFLSALQEPYLQKKGSAYVPHLSIIDLLMHLGFAGTRKQLQNYTLID